MAKGMKTIHRDYEITIKESGTVIVQLNGKVCGNTVKELRTIAEDVNFPYSDEWNTRHFGKKLVAFLSQSNSQTLPSPIQKEFRVNSTNNQSDVIALNRMYVGDYLNDNLGHEIINLYKADNGKSYLYLNAHGTFDSKWENRIKTMFLVRTVEGMKMLEVIGVAVGMSDVYHQGQSGEEQEQYIVQNGIKYAGKYLHDIFKDNKWQQDINISFVAEKVLLPQKKVFLSFNPEIRDKNDQYSCVCYLEDVNQAKASLKQYIDLETVPTAYKKLVDLAHQSYLWYSDTSKVNQQVGEKRPITYFDICGISYNELAFSNAIAYFFEKYPHLISGFMNSIGHSFDASKKVTIYREKMNIDILITNGAQSIVLENKITSGINGIDRHDTNKSQLLKYYELLNGVLKNQFPNPSFFVLTPNYNDIDLSQYAGGKYYTKLLYGQFYEFLIAQPEYNSDILFQNFVNAVERHASYYCNDQYEEMKQRFLTIINN